jgi:Icc-related predicted phosphoesterase
MRLYFVTDIHGSEVCFRKFLNSHQVYNPDVMVVGGDITGKVVVPLIGSNGSRTAVMAHGEVPLEGRDVIAAFERQIADTGSYTWHCTDDEYEEARGDERRIDAIFHEAVLDRAQRWMELAQERLGDAKVRILMSGGNDDFWEIDDVLKSAAKVECPDDAVVALGDGIQLLSLGLANKTPWDCPRDVTEDVLGRRLETLAGELDTDATHVFNLHVPPHDSRIDLGPALDETNRPRLGMGGIEPAPVGSTAVREAIERHQPILSLHGHVHESRGTAKIGRTLAINPGSEYNQGLLRGAIVQLKKGKVKMHQLTAG